METIVLLVAIIIMAAASHRWAADSREPGDWSGNSAGNWSADVSFAKRGNQ